MHKHPVSIHHNIEYLLVNLHLKHYITLLSSWTLILRVLIRIESSKFARNEKFRYFNSATIFHLISAQLQFYIVKNRSRKIVVVSF